MTTLYCAECGDIIGHTENEAVAVVAKDEIYCDDCKLNAEATNAAEEEELGDQEEEEIADNAEDEKAKDEKAEEDK